MIKATIIIPNINGKGWLKDSIESIYAQTEQDFDDWHRHDCHSYRYHQLGLHEHADRKKAKRKKQFIIGCVLTECDHFYLLVEKYIEKAPYRGVWNIPACL